MTLWNKTRLTAIYTLTPLHFGVGQAASAVDLPITRDAGTGFPLIPATGLKGVARNHLVNVLGKEHPDIKEWFGPDLDVSKGDQDEAIDLSAGALTFTEGRLIAYPVRSLNRPFLHVTCPLIVERLARDLRAAGLADDFGIDAWPLEVSKDQAWVASEELAGKALVLEDLVYEAGETEHSADLASFAAQLAELLPETEEATRKRLREGLVMLCDADFSELITRVIPVRARIKLNENKTTGDGGNLWYEAHLPPDCLFLSLVAERRQRDEMLDKLREHAEHLATVQIGGNETVGYGLCWWSGWNAEDPA